MNTNLKLNFSNEDQGLVVEMGGDLDISSSPKFTEAVEENFNKDSDIIFDMEDLDYIDSTGLGAFMTIFRQIKDTDYDIEIINAKDNIKKIFTITELDKVFRMK